MSAPSFKFATVWLTNYSGSRTPIQVNDYEELDDGSLYTRLTSGAEIWWSRGAWESVEPSS